MVLKVATIFHQEVADICGFNLSSIGSLYIETWTIPREIVLLNRGEEEVVLIGAARERATASFAKEITVRGLSVGKVFGLILADSDSQD